MIRRTLTLAAIAAVALTTAGCFKVPSFGVAKPAAAEPIALAAVQPAAVATVEAPVTGRPAPAVRAPVFVPPAIVAELAAPAAVPTLPVPQASAAPTEIKVTVAAPAPAADTRVTWGWGDELSRWMRILEPVLVPALVSLALWLLSLVAPYLPGPVGLAVRMWFTERTMRELVGRSYTAVAGAAEGREVTVDVGNQQLAYIASTALRELPPRMIRWMGGEDGIRAKASAVIPFEAEASSASVNAA